MKNNLNQHIRQLVAAACCGLLLFGAPILAQDAPGAGNAQSETTTNKPSDTAPDADSPSGTRARRHRGGQQNALVRFNENVELKEGETADAVVVINGNAKVNGKVRDAAVVIGGNLEVNGEVGDAVVAVLGDVKLGPNAHVRGDVVSVGGPVTQEEGAVVEGEMVPVNFGAFGMPRMEWLRSWVVHCGFKLRPLAPQVGWVWAGAGIFFLFYLLVAVALPRPVQACVGELTRRPVTTFSMGLLTIFLAPLVLLILAITVIGGIVVPFALAALFFGALIGKVGFLEYLGAAVQKGFGMVQAPKPLLALLVGSAILVLLYLVPILGLVTFAVVGMWGLGAAVTAAFGSLKREAPEKPAPPAMSPITSPSGLAPMPVAGAPAYPAQSTPSDAAAFAAGASAGFDAGSPASMSAQIPGVPAPTPAIPEALTYPRASFWDRMAAALLDLVLLGVVIGMVGRFGGPPFGFLIALAYFAGMWAWRGTTVGGIVLNLKVVRLDGSPLTFVAALVRGLAAAFSVVVLFLGFLWIAWDKEKQGWHDRIAGTVVIRLPRGTPLVLV